MKRVAKFACMCLALLQLGTWMSAVGVLGKTPHEANQDNSSEPWCVTLPMVDGYKEFCNITMAWTPRLSRFEGVALCVALAIAAASFTLVCLYFWREEYKEKLNAVRQYISRNDRKCKICKKKLVYISFLSVAMYDVFDVWKDIYLFYDVEFGGVIDANIFRNVGAQNGILAFGCLGAIKIIIVLVMFRSFTIKKASHLTNVQGVVSVVVYLFEDGAETFLEYFYLERFYTIATAWYVMLGDVITAIYLGYAVCVVFQIDTLNIVVRVLFASVALPQIIRIFGATYQSLTLRLDNGCVAVVDGALVQTPFAVDCMRRAEYALIVFNFLPLVIGGALIVWTIYVVWRR